jgi:hypothetical protein
VPRWVFMLTIAAGVAAPALVYGLASSAATGPAGARITGPAEIRITSRETKRTRVDVGRDGKRTGDTEIIRYNLFNRRIKSKPIGFAEYVCTFTTSQSRACTVTVFLPRGRLMAGGSIRYPELYELAVLGGTRLYDNARGTLTVIRTTERPRRHILVFRLTG